MCWTRPYACSKAECDNCPCWMAKDTPRDQLARRLLEDDASALLIVDGQQRLVGIASYAGVLRALLAREAAA